MSKTPTILCCDPSFTAWGYAVVDIECRLYDSGKIKTEPKSHKLKIRKGEDRVRRILEILVPLNDLIEKHNICLIVSELPHGSQNANASIMIGVVTGILQTMSYFMDIPIEWYDQGEAKKLLLGKREGEKEEIIEVISEMYPEREWGQWRKKGEDEAIADSLAIYELAREESPVLLHWQRMRNDEPE